MLPVDILRYITQFLLVQEAIRFENNIAMKLNSTCHYKMLKYKQPFKRKEFFNGRYIEITTENIHGKVFSNVTLPKKSFVITHREDISTKNANTKAFKLMCGSQNSLICASLRSMYLNPSGALLIYTPH
jgi:hypothetical protein